jgi:hypothetical protein
VLKTRHVEPNPLLEFKHNAACLIRLAVTGIRESPASNTLNPNPAPPVSCLPCCHRRSRKPAPPISFVIGVCESLEANGLKPTPPTLQYCIFLISLPSSSHHVFLKEYTIYISELFYKWGKLVVFVVVFLNWRIITDSKDIRYFSGKARIASLKMVRRDVALRIKNEIYQHELGNSLPGRHNGLNVV